MEIFMKKALIITLRLHNNYGGIIQAYALQTVVEKYGYKVDVYNNTNNYPKFKDKFIICIKQVVKLCLGRHIDYIWPIYDSESNYRIISQHTRKFIDRYIHIRNVKDLKELEDEYDCFIAGSDQVWRPAYFGKIENAFFDFVQCRNVKRIAYAASFGTNKWEYNTKQTSNCQKLIKKFDAVSVREKSGVDLCAKYFNINSVHLLDPTMLLKREDYSLLANSSGVAKSDGSLFVYVLDNNEKIIKLVNVVYKVLNLIPFSINSKYEDINAKISDRIQPPVEKWLRGFSDAEFVITDSFHACVFSILYNKPFLVVGNKNRGMERFISLLEDFGLMDRLISDDNCEALLKKQIDWDYVNSRLKVRREESLFFLEKYLKG